MVQFVTKVYTNKFESICSVDFYHHLVDSFVKSRFSIETHYDAIEMSNVFYNQVYSMLNALSYAINPN